MSQAYIVTTVSRHKEKFTFEEIWSVFDSQEKATQWINKFPKEEAEAYRVQIWDIK